MWPLDSFPKAHMGHELSLPPRPSPSTSHPFLCAFPLRPQDLTVSGSSAKNALPTDLCVPFSPPSALSQLSLSWALFMATVVPFPTPALMPLFPDIFSLLLANIYILLYLYSLLSASPTKMETPGRQGWSSFVHFVFFFVHPVGTYLLCFCLISLTTWTVTQNQGAHLNCYWQGQGYRFLFLRITLNISKNNIFFL